MEEMGWDLPFHLGVTEAANGLEGRVKGALGVGILLSQGIGNTLRISLTESPVQEVRFARKLLRFLEKNSFPCPPFSPKEVPVWEVLPPHPPPTVASICPFPPGLDGDERIFSTIQLLLSTPDLSAVHLEEGPDRDQRRAIVEAVLQACGWGRFSTEIIACPTCGRTSCDVAALVEGVRNRLGRLPHLKIAIMGCVVNGIGEMGDADYGCMGCGGGKVNLYHNGICVQSGVEEGEAIDALENRLARDGKLVQSGHGSWNFPWEKT
jgi:(E)-4-hydroxy-3-methylbut-2-enyl-diphosphate synthase